MSTTREPCGCKHDGHKWVSMCDAHRSDFEATHRRWSDEHFGRVAIITESPPCQSFATAAVLRC